MQDRTFAPGALLFVAAFLLALGAVAEAEQPRAAVWHLVEAAGAGRYEPGPTPGGDSRILVDLLPVGEQARLPVLIVFQGCGEDPATPNRPILNLEDVLRRGAQPKHAEWQDPGPRWRLCPEEDAVVAWPGQGARVELGLDFIAPFQGGVSPRVEADVHQLEEDDLRDLEQSADPAAYLARKLHGRSPAARLEIDLHYRLREGFFRRGEWHQVYGSPLSNELFARATGDYEQLAQMLPVDVLSFRQAIPIPKETEDDGGRLFERTLKELQVAGSGLAGEKICTSEPYRMPAGDRQQGPGPALFVPYTLSGRFSTRWTSDHSLHPGWGFRVEAWTTDFGFWHQLASDWVQSDGTWTLNVPASALFLGNHLRIYYRTRTSYYDVKDLSDNRYAWRDPDRYNIATSFYAGHRYADTDGGAYSGIGELVDAAMWTWSRLYWDGGINPVPASPINVYAPNTSYDCGDGSGVPWSCASVSGNIWLIASHAVRARTVAHELGHQLNYKYWDYKRPANAGGSHNANTCYSTRAGMTLLEGFATYIAGWVGYPGRNVAPGGFGSGRWSLGGADLEQRVSPPSCTSGWQNETWVARTFWDLHDTRADGQDVLWFNHLGAVAALYLANGVANDGDARDMRFYENVYRNAASSGHQGFISDIFDNNRH